jgi:hypothetical protein
MMHGAVSLLLSTLTKHVRITSLFPTLANTARITPFVSKIYEKETQK